MARTTAFLASFMAALAGMAGPLQAQTSRGPIVLSLPADTRAAALGDAFVAASNDATALFYNPALVGKAGGFALGRAWYGGDGAFAQAAAATSSTGRGLAVGVRSLSYGARQPTPAASPRLATSPAMLFGRGSAALEQVATVAGAMRLFGFQVGVAASLLETRVDTLRAGGATFDVGVAKEMGPVVFGLAAQGLGPGPVLGSGTAAQRYDAPTRATLNMATRRGAIGPVDVGAAAAVSGWDGYFAAAGGLEITYWPVIGRTIAGRVGVRHDDDGTRPTFGAAIQLDNLAFAYAFEHFAAGNVQRIGLVFRP
jgi:hypothetical protein